MQKDMTWTGQGWVHWRCRTCRHAQLCFGAKLHTAQGMTSVGWFCRQMWRCCSSSLGSCRTTSGARLVSVWLLCCPSSPARARVARHSRQMCRPPSRLQLTRMETLLRHRCRLGIWSARPQLDLQRAC